VQNAPKSTQSKPAVTTQQPSAAKVANTEAPPAQLSTPAQRQQQTAAPKSKNLFPEDEAPKKEAAAVVEPASPVKKVKNCTCGMPLCICPADKDEAKEEEQASKEAKKPAPEKKTAAPVSKAQSSTQTTTFSGFGASSAGKYDLKGDLNEQARDAIKNGDFAGLQKLLQAGADPRYCDRTGNTLVHLAALFNHENMVNFLVKQGADVWVKNPSGETAIDVAQPALGAKMKEFPKKS
jgi:hypothetical protein